MAEARESKLASFYEPRASVVEAVESNAAAVQVEAEEVAEEGTSNNDDDGLGLPYENEPAAKKSLSELKMDMNYFQQPFKDDDRFSGTTDNFIINFGIFKEILSNTVCKVSKDGSLSVIEVNKKGMARGLTLSC